MGQVIGQPGFWIKHKLTILFILGVANFMTPALYVIGTVLLIISTILTVYSGIECIVKNKEVLKEAK